MKVEVKFKEKTFICESDQPLLFSMQKHGAFMPSSCQSGICHSCLSIVTQGTVPDVAQSGLSETQKKAGYFLPCICKPKEHLEFELAPRKTNPES